ncbi:MAG: hypothetical protein IJR49_03225 [Treponema sp.]|nr:hypothetical protein [Treponema sp.]
MKNRFLFFAILLTCTSLFAQSEGKQFISPKKIYIGDTAELQYSFYSAVDLLGTSENDQLVHLNLDSLSFPKETSEYTILSCTLKKDALDYLLTLTFIPWKTGNLVFPNFDLASSIFKTDESSFIIQFEPISISSIVQEKNINTVRPSLPPLLLPGTIYVLYAILIFILILIIIAIRLVTQWQKIIDRYNAKQQLRLYARNAKEMNRQLALLEKNSKKMDDYIFCAELQKLIRHYLEYRFDYRFTAISTPQVTDAFEEITAGLMTEQKQVAAMSISAVLKRTDYIRYAKNSIDAEKEPQDQYAAILAEDERGSLIRITKDAVNRFEERKQYA